MAVRSILAATVAAASFAAAQAQTMVDRIRLTEIKDFLQEAGAIAVVAQTASGTPLIEGQAKGLNFQALGLQCDEKGFAAPCAYVVFRVGIPDAPLDPALRFANEYDERNAYGRAFVDARGVLILDYGVDLDGGVSRAHIRKLSLFWVEKVMPDFIASAVDFLTPYAYAPEPKEN